MHSEGPVHLRRAVIDDAAGIARVHAQVWQRAHAGLVPEESLACIRRKSDERFWQAELKLEAPDRTPWVALVDDDVVGFALGGICDDRSAGRAIGEVYSIDVESENWEHGVGSALLRHVLRDLREHGFTQAIRWIPATDTSDQALARMEGWHCDGVTRVEECPGGSIEQIRYSRALE